MKKLNTLATLLVSALLVTVSPIAKSSNLLDKVNNKATPLTESSVYNCKVGKWSNKKVNLGSGYSYWELSTITKCKVNVQTKHDVSAHSFELTTELVIENNENPYFDFKVNSNKGAMRSNTLTVDGLTFSGWPTYSSHWVNFAVRNTDDFNKLFKGFEKKGNFSVIGGRT